MERYSRQIMLPEIGNEGQKKLSEASVLLVGVGGLGSPISLYLTGAGIGRIGLIDADVVSESNLQRQVLYTEQESRMCETSPSGSVRKYTNRYISRVFFRKKCDEFSREI